MREVEHKLEKLSRLRTSQLNKYMQKHPIKVLRSPQNEFYIVDHHHLLAVLWLLGVKKVPIRVDKNYARRQMSRPRFWKFLASRRLMHLYDQFGNGPHEPLYLPEDIRGLGDAHTEVSCGWSSRRMESETPANRMPSSRGPSSSGSASC
jgi:hypothetical protein